jgi:DNA-binding transcriptional MerR regulator
MPLTVTAREVSRRSNVSLRQIQTWTNAGALLADEGRVNPGRGGSRQYPQTEVDVAMLIGAIAFHGMSVTELKSVADHLRRILRLPAKMRFSTPAEASRIACQMAPKSDHKGKRSTNDYLDLCAWIAIEEAKKGRGRAILLLNRDESGAWRHQILTAGRPKPKDGLNDNRWRGGYAINLVGLFGKE